MSRVGLVPSGDCTSLDGQRELGHQLPSHSSCPGSLGSDLLGARGCLLELCPRDNNVFSCLSSLHILQLKSRKKACGPSDPSAAHGQPVGLVLGLKPSS